MTKMIVAGALGFFTIPLAVFALIVAVEVTKYIAAFGMMPSHYWGGFFIMGGMFAIFVASMPFWLD